MNIGVTFINPRVDYGDDYVSVSTNIKYNPSHTSSSVEREGSEGGDILLSPPKISITE